MLWKKPTNLIVIVAIIVGIVFFVGFELGLAISGAQILGFVIFLGFLGFLFYFLLHSSNRRSTMEAARNFAVEWWKKSYGEELSRADSKGIEGYFGDTQYFGFRFKRLGGYKIGQWIILVIKHTGAMFDVSKYEDYPTPDQLEDPFKIMEGYLYRTPIPTEPIPKYVSLPYGYSKQPYVNVNVGKEKEADEFKKLSGK